MSEERWQKKSTPELLFELEAHKRRVEDHIAAYNRKRARGASDAELAEHQQEIVEMGGMVGRDMKLFVAERLIQELEAEQQSGSAAVLPRLSADEIRVYFEQGEDHLKQREFHQAVMAYNTVLRHNPDNAEAYYYRGLVFAFAPSARAHSERAQADYSAAIRLKPDFIEAYLKRADSYGTQQPHPEVIDDYTAVLRLVPDHHHAWVWRGFAYYLAKQYPEAIADLSHAIDLKPEDSQAYWFRSGVYLNMEEFDRALADCEKAEQLGRRGVSWRVDQIHRKREQKNG